MYESFFGLREKPFNVTPDPRFLYLSPSHQEALASMIYGITERRGFVAIIGAVGTGKTTLLHTLFSELGTEVKTVFIFNTKVSFHQLLQNILVELELTPKSSNKSELFNQLNDFLIEKHALGENVALVIDEAQNLSSSVLEELRMLSNLETPRAKLLQIVLVGQPELDTKLRSHNLRQLKQRIAISCYLTPLNHDEQLRYISHRLSVAGCRDNHVFSNSALELISRNSRGIPRIINIWCDNAMLSAYATGKKKIDADIIEDIIADYNERVPDLTIASKPKCLPQVAQRRLITKSRLVFVSSVLVIIAVLLLELAAFSSQSNPVNRFIDNMVEPRLALVWQIVEQRLFNVKHHDSLHKSGVLNSHPPQTVISQSPRIDAPAAATGDIKAKADEQIIGAGLVPEHESSSVAPTNITQERNNPAQENVNERSSSSGRSAQSVPAPDPTDIAPVKHNPKTVLAKPGDTISSFILKEYGIINDIIFDMVKQANPDIKDLDKIYIGQKIILPGIDGDTAVLEIAEGVFSIYLASFISYDSAKEYLNRLQGREEPLFLSPVSIAGKSPLYRVTLGGFNTREEAQEAAKRLQPNLQAFSAW